MLSDTKFPANFSELLPECDLNMKAWNDVTAGMLGASICNWIINEMLALCGIWKQNMKGTARGSFGKRHRSLKALCW